MLFERQVVLRGWGEKNQAALESATARVPMAGDAFAVAEKYLYAAGIGKVVFGAAREFSPGLEAAVEDLPWHSAGTKLVGSGAAVAVDWLVFMLRAQELRP